MRLGGPYDKWTGRTTAPERTLVPIWVCFGPFGVDLAPAVGEHVERTSFQGWWVLVSEWTEWVARVTRGETSRQVGERIGHSHTTALRWMHDGASPEAVIGLALAYDADVVEALVVSGWLEAKDVRRLNLDSALRQLPPTHLTGELHRRAREAEAARRERARTEERLDSLRL